MESADREKILEEIKTLRERISALESMLELENDERQITIDDLEEQMYKKEKELEQAIMKEVEKFNSDAQKIEKNLQIVKASLTLSVDVEKINVTEALNGLTAEIKELNDESNKLSLEIESFTAEIKSQSLQYSAKEIKRKVKEFKIRLRDLKRLQVEKYNLRVDLFNKIVEMYKNEFANDSEIMKMLDELGLLSKCDANVNDWRQNTYSSQINYNALIDFNSKLSLIEVKLNERRIENGVIGIAANLDVANDKLLDIDVVMNTSEFSDEFILEVDKKLNEVSDLFLLIGNDLEKLKKQMPSEKYSEYSLRYNDLMQTYLSLQKATKEIQKSSINGKTTGDSLFKAIDVFGTRVMDFNFSVVSLNNLVVQDSMNVFEGQMVKFDEIYKSLMGEIEEKYKNKLIDENQYKSMLARMKTIEEKLTDTRLKLDNSNMYMMPESLLFTFLNGKIDGVEAAMDQLEKTLEGLEKPIKDRKIRREIDSRFKRLEAEIKSLERQLEDYRDSEPEKYHKTKEKLNISKKRLVDLGKKYRRKCPLLVRTVKSAKNFFKKYKKQLLILAGLIAFIMASYSVIIPAIMHGNIMLAGLSPALRGPITVINNLLGGIIGATKNPIGIWSLANGVQINPLSASSSLLKGLAISGLGTTALLAPVIVMVKKLIEKMKTAEFKQKLVVVKNKTAGAKDRVVEETKASFEKINKIVKPDEFKKNLDVAKNIVVKTKDKLVEGTKTKFEEINEKNENRRVNAKTKKQIKNSIKKVLSDYSHSGLTADEYCKQNNLDEFWLYLLKSYDEEAKKNKEDLNQSKGGRR